MGERDVWDVGWVRRRRGREEGAVATQATAVATLPLALGRCVQGGERGWPCAWALQAQGKRNRGGGGKANNKRNRTQHLHFLVGRKKIVLNGDRCTAAFGGGGGGALGPSCVQMAACRAFLAFTKPTQRMYGFRIVSSTWEAARRIVTFRPLKGAARDPNRFLRRGGKTNPPPTCTTPSPPASSKPHTHPLFQPCGPLRGWDGKGSLQPVPTPPFTNHACRFGKECLGSKAINARPPHPPTPTAGPTHPTHPPTRSLTPPHHDAGVCGVAAAHPPRPDGHLLPPSTSSCMPS